MADEKKFLGTTLGPIKSSGYGTMLDADRESDSGVVFNPANSSGGDDKRIDTFHIPLSDEGHDMAEELEGRRIAEQDQRSAAEQFKDYAVAQANTNTFFGILLNNLGSGQINPPDPEFSQWYSDNQYKIEYGLSQEEREDLRELESKNDVDFFLKQRENNNAQLRNLTAYGEAPAFLGAVVTGGTDPTTWLAGGMIGKVASLSKVPAFVANESRAITSLRVGTEQVAGSLLLDATLDAAGAHMTPFDYILDAGLQGFMGAGVAALAHQDLRTAVDSGNVEIYRRAQDKAGPDATAADVARAADELVLTDINSTPAFPDHIEEPIVATGDKGELPLMGVDEVADDVIEEVDMGAALPFDAADADVIRGVREEAKTIPKLTLTADAEVPAGERFSSARETLQRISESSAIPHEQMLASRLIEQLHDDVQMHMLPDNSTDRSYYNPRTQTIHMRKGAGDDVMLHEISHAVTAERLVFGKHNPNTEIGRITRDIEGLRQHVIKELDKVKAGDHLSYPLWYRTKNADEFAAAFYSNDQGFIDALSKIKDPQGQPILSKLVDLFRQLLGLDAGEANAFIRGLGLTDELISKPLDVTVKPRGGVEIKRRMAPGQLTQQDALLTPVAGTDRLLPDVSGLSLDSEGKLPQPKEFLTDARTRNAAAKKAGITEWTVLNGTERAFLGDIIARAEAWAGSNPIDPSRQSITTRVPWIASVSSLLANSTNPVARMVSGMLLESPSGLTGRRGRTAAITKHLLQRQYMTFAGAFEQQYKGWRKTQGGNIVTDIKSLKDRQRFNDLVYEEITRRGLSPDSEPLQDVFVLRAADQVEAGMDRMRKDLQKSAAPGSLNLPDSSVGYVERRMSQGWLLNSTLSQREALSKLMAKQLSGGVFGNPGWDDPAFAKRIAVQYVQRAYNEAHGSVSVPVHLDNPEAAGLLRDVLRAEGIPPEEAEKFLSKLTRGGAKTTKSRLDLDVSEAVTLGDGGTFRIMDALDRDVAKLYQQYALRTSGEVALTTHGVPGKAGLDMLRKALQYNGDMADTDALRAELRAFDQMAAEFYGTPMASTGHSKVLDNLRLLTSASRLGGMAYSAFAETANALGALGVSATLSAVASFPRMIQDVRLGRSNPFLDSLEELAGPIGRNHEIIIPFQDVNDVRLITGDHLTAADRAIRAGSQALPWFNGFHHLVSAQQRGMTEQIVKKSWRMIRDGKTDAALRDMGLTDDLVTRLREELENVAEFDAKGHLTRLDLRNGDDAQAIGEYLTAVHRGTNQIIQGTFIGETGFWAHQDHLRVLTQFRSFSITAMEKQWSRQKGVFGAPKAVGLLLGMAGFALPIHLARVQVASIGREDREDYLDKQLSTPALGRALLNYVSLAGLAGDVLDISYATATGETIQGGRAGASGMIGAMIPAAGYVEGAARVLRERDPKEAVRLLPGGSLPYVTAALNAAIEDD